jgi:phosphohistidine phosphatase
LIGAPVGSLRLRKAGLCHLHWSRPSVHTFGTARLEALLRPRFLLPGPV